ncbi:hypothetical protein RBH26_21045, partial [Natronolimnohabitans sp. A-GB9]|uniref:hypothetical protein n=1 Tax=Natronolimnohabitans sp. A-GB9 TaxID=3069757 RepID=UPI0027AFD4FE
MSYKITVVKEQSYGGNLNRTIKGNSAEEVLEELENLDDSWEVNQYCQEKVEELKKEVKPEHGLDNGSHGIAISPDRAEKWGIETEELGHSSEENTEDTDTQAEELIEEEGLSGAWQAAYE